MSKFDQYYRKIIVSTIYREGWGLPQDLAKIIHYRRNIVGNRENCLKIVPKDYPIKIEKELQLKDHNLIEGSFLSPFTNYIGALMPEEIKTARFQFIIPKNWKSRLRPVVFHFAGTGDQHFWRRRLLIAKPLLAEHSVASLILENPFYGSRKPKDQNRSNLNYVKDLFVMGGCIVTEALAMMNWCENLGFGPFALTGLSMGGHFACLASTVWPKPLALIPCLSWTTAGPSFTRGVLAKDIPWKKLQDQYYSNKEYQLIKERLEELHEEENKRRPEENKQICSFLKDSNDFKNLINFNEFDKKDSINIEVVKFMHLLMDECTHLLNYDSPVDKDLIKVISAQDDAYVLRDGVNDFNSIWPGTQVEYLDKGHVSAFVLAQNKFRENIIAMLNKLIEKHYS